MSTKTRHVRSADADPLTTSLRGCRAARRADGSSGQTAGPGWTWRMPGERRGVTGDLHRGRAGDCTVSHTAYGQIRRFPTQRSQRYRPMAYTPEAEEARRCTAIKADGSPCRAWAVWDDDRQLCVVHAGRCHRGPRTGQRRSEKTNYLPCTCEAYAWPHRPGGGVCLWPAPPVVKCLTPAGKKRS